MILDMKGRLTTSAHLICFTNNDNSSYIATYPKFGWTSNFNFARCYDNIDEALEFINSSVVQSLIGDVNICLMWTDTKEIIINS